VINARNIFGLVLIVLFVIYDLFHIHGNSFWASYYYVTWNLIGIYAFRYILKSSKDKLLRVIMKIFMGVTVFELILNTYSFFNIERFRELNHTKELGCAVVCCVIIFLIYSRHERMVR